MTKHLAKSLRALAPRQAAMWSSQDLVETPSTRLVGGFELLRA